MASISGFGNGIGYLYRVRSDGTTISATLNNDLFGREIVLTEALTTAPLTNETIAVGVITVTAANGTINTATVNAVAIISGAVAGATTSAQAANLAAAINSHTSSPDYTAVAYGATCYIYAAPGSGSTPNGFAVATTVSAPTTTTTRNMGGGSGSTGVSDATFGYCWFINDDPAAPEASLTGAVEITAQVTGRNATNSVYVQTQQILSGVLVPDRVGANQVVYVATEGGVGADDLDTITINGASEGDTVTFYGSVAGDIVTFKNGTGNLNLAGAQDFDSGDLTRGLVLRYLGGNWYEVSRTPVNPITVASLRSDGIAVPVQGTDGIVLTNAGGSIILTPGSSKGFQKVTGNVTLAGSWTIDGDPVVVQNGDSFWLDYQGTITLNGNNITIGGRALTATEALSGRFLAFMYWDGAAWQTEIVTRGTTLIDFSADTDVGTPASTVETTLRSASLAAGKLGTDGSQLFTEDVITFAANANTKTVRKKFGATTIATVSGAYNGVVMRLLTRIVRTGAATQKVYWNAFINGENVISDKSSATEALAGAVTILTTGQNGTASASDVVCNSTLHTVMIK